MSACRARREAWAALSKTGIRAFGHSWVLEAQQLVEPHPATPETVTAGAGGWGAGLSCDRRWKVAGGEPRAGRRGPSSWIRDP